jgi:hypothetical protein
MLGAGSDSENSKDILELSDPSSGRNYPGISAGSTLTFTPTSLLATSSQSLSESKFRYHFDVSGIESGS